MTATSRTGIALVAGLLTVAPLAMGCSATAPNLAEEGLVTVVMLPTDGMQVRKAGVYQRADVTVVSGRLAGRGRLYRYREGHVDVAVYSRAGEELQRASAAPKPRSPASRRRRLGHTFAMSLPGIVPHGSVVRVSFHEGYTDEEDEVYDCGDNKALAEVAHETEDGDSRRAVGHARLLTGSGNPRPPQTKG